MLNKLFLIAVLACCSILSINGQNTEKLKGLISDLEKATHDTTRIKINIKIAYYYEVFIPDSAFLYYQETLKIINKAINNSSPNKDNLVYFIQKANVYTDIAALNRDLGNFSIATEYFEKALTICKDLLNDFPDHKKLNWQLSKCYIHYGIAFYNQSNYNDAIECFLSALAINEKVGDKKGISYCFNNIGAIYKEWGDYNKAIEYYLEALKINEEMGNKELMANNYNNIGTIYNGQNRNEKAIEYYKKALEIKKDLGDKKGEALCFNNIGLAYYSMVSDTNDDALLQDSLCKLAFDYYQNAGKTYESFNDRGGMAYVFNNIGLVYSTQGNLIKAIEYNQKALKLLEELGEKIGISMSNANIASHYLDLAIKEEKLGNNEYISFLNLASQYGTKAYNLALEIGAIHRRNHAASILQRTYFKLGNYKEALKYAEIFISTKDSIFTEEKSTAIEELMVKYETEKKDNEIKLLNHEKEINKIIIENSKKERLFYIIIALALASLLILLYRSYLNRKKVNIILERKNEELKILNSTKDKFISILAHDLKNPLAAFYQITETLNNNYAEIEEKDKRHFISELNKSSARLNGMLKDMLDWATIQSSSKFTSLEKINLKNVIELVNENLNTFSKQKEVEIKINIDSDLNANANKGACITIINNLLTNAIKFSPEKSTIDITGYKENNQVIINVIDKGVGITQEDIEKLFRIDVDTRSIGKSEGKGTGLGLIICKDLIDKMNGKIWAKSNFDEGTIFSFSLPCLS